MAALIYSLMATSATSQKLYIAIATNNPPRKIFLYHKANWEAIRQNLFVLANDFPQLLMHALKMQMLNVFGLYLETHC